MKIAMGFAMVVVVVVAMEVTPLASLVAAMEMTSSVATMIA